MIALTTQLKGIFRLQRLYLRMWNFKSSHLRDLKELCTFWIGLSASKGKKNLPWHYVSESFFFFSQGVLMCLGMCEGMHWKRIQFVRLQLNHLWNIHRRKCTYYISQIIRGGALSYFHTVSQTLHISVSLSLSHTHTHTHTHTRRMNG